MRDSFGARRVSRRKQRCKHRKRLAGRVKPEETARTFCKLYFGPAQRDTRTQRNVCLSDSGNNSPSMEHVLLLRKLVSNLDVRTSQDHQRLVRTRRNIVNLVGKPKSTNVRFVPLTNTVLLVLSSLYLCSGSLNSLPRLNERPDKHLPSAQQSWVLTLALSQITRFSR